MELRTLRYFVAVAEELHFGRAAARLHMSQPPLSRAIKRLEADVGALLLTRSPAGVTLTPVGRVLLDEARALLDRADLVRDRVSAAAGPATLTVGILGDGTDPGISALAAAHRRGRPGMDIRVRDTDLTDPTCGLRAGLVDVALTRGPFDETALTVRVLRTDPVGAVLRADDPLARRARLRLAELSDRRWFRFPPGTDPAWQSYWHGGAPARARWCAPCRNACRPCCGTARSAWHPRARAAGGVGRGAAGRHGAEPGGGGVERRGHQPVDPFLRGDRHSRVPPLSAGRDEAVGVPPPRP